MIIMRKLFVLLVITCLFLTGCIQGRRSSAPETGQKDSVTVEASPVAQEPDTLFVSMRIPPEIEARMRGVSYPVGATISLQELRYLRLSYIDFEGNMQVGELVCNKLIANDLLAIFRELYSARYPIRSIRLIDDFGGSDDVSMAADNTSCFNYRPVSGGKSLSKHALGLAVDINPLENPYIRNETVLPPNATAFVNREESFPHKIDKTDLCYQLFIERGFAWGGNWRSLKDYQHFEK